MTESKQKSDGEIIAAQGNLITVKFRGDIRQNEVAFIHSADKSLKGEVIEINGEEAKVQVFELTKGIKPGDKVSFDSDLLSVELGPGLLKTVYDGLQNPLEELAVQSGYFLPRGIYLPPLDRETKWDFTPLVKAGDEVEKAVTLGTVPEGTIEHKIMVPFNLFGRGEIVEIAPKGQYTVDREIAKIKDEKGDIHSVSMMQRWPAKFPISFGEKILPMDLLDTGCRIIDGPFPVTKGGTFCVPGPFGAGKTVLQQQLAKYAHAQVVIIVACGERAGEVVEVLREFPELTDPQSGKKLMERTCIICNTSSMPVAARESSIYIGVTIAEYYRQMGVDCLLLADSTSRWAQALREMSGRLEEIPGEEAFPAYLASRIAELYERAGVIVSKNGTGSLTICGTVSPAGGNFEEPVTQSTLAVVGCFLGLSRSRSDARRFPAIDPFISWSKYLDRLSFEGNEKEIHRIHMIKSAQATLQASNEIGKKMAVIGEEAMSLGDVTTFLKGEFYDAVFLQQNAFDEVDTATDKERQDEQIELVDMVMKREFVFSGNDEARRFFMDLTNAFIQWNYTSKNIEEYMERKKEIEGKIASH